jgi:thiamine-phosphate pyrophosphorylase
MADSLILYYITDRTALAGDEPTRRRRLLEKVSEAARAGVDYIQLREKDLSIRELEVLAREAVQVIARAKTESPELKTRLLINSRVDVAVAANADGVHLQSVDVSPRNVAKIWDSAKSSSRTPGDRPLIGVSCHSAAEVSKAADDGATLAVFGPVFEKGNSQPTGLAALHEACRANIPVLALGGVTIENARGCLDAGATGIAAIRLFQENDIREVVQRLVDSSAKRVTQPGR